MAERKKGGSLKSDGGKPPAPFLYASFVELFMSPKFELVSGLSTIVVTKEVGNQIAEALLNIFEVYSDQTFELMKWAVGVEVEQATSATTLFRGASFSTRLMSAFYRKVGDSYLKQVLGPLLSEITTRSGSYEIDPLKAAPTDNIEENYKKVQELTEQVLDGILNSVDQCPNSIKQLLNYAKEKVVQKFPDVGQTVIGASIFLRFICPAIVAPQESGLLSESPSAEARRGMVLISKLLQNLANELPFELKESFMLPFNQFITDNIPRIREFLSQITQPPRRESNPSPKHFPLPTEEQVGESVMLLHGLIQEHRDKIDKFMDRNFPSNFASLFMSRLDEVVTSTGTLKKKRMSFFARPKSRTNPPITEEELRRKSLDLEHVSHVSGQVNALLLPQRVISQPQYRTQPRTDDKLKRKSLDLDPYPGGHANSLLVPERRHSSVDDAPGDAIEKQFKAQVDVFITYFQTKLREKEKQLQEAREANIALHNHKDQRDISASGSKEEPRPLNASGSDSRSLTLSGSREFDARDEELNRLRTENVELSKKVELLHEDNCKLRDQVRTLTRTQNATSPAATPTLPPTPAPETTPSSSPSSPAPLSPPAPTPAPPAPSAPASAPTSLPTSPTPAPDQLAQGTYELLMRTRSDIERLAELVAAPEREKKDRKKKEKDNKRESSRRAKKLKSRLTHMIEGLDSAGQEKYLEMFEKLVVQDKQKV